MDIELINKAIDHFGKESQITKAVEEMGELTAELCRSLNHYGTNVNIIEEIADVLIMMTQLKEIFGPDLVDTHIAVKMRRLKNLIDDESRYLK